MAGVSNFAASDNRRFISLINCPRSRGAVLKFSRVNSGTDSPTGGSGVSSKAGSFSSTTSEVFVSSGGGTSVGTVSGKGSVLDVRDSCASG